jgi:hypothetical protein
MKYSWYPYIRHTGSRLRERKNNPFRPGFYRFSKYYSDSANSRGIYKKDSILESGFTLGETWGCLEKTWVESRAPKKLENNKDIKTWFYHSIGNSDL